MTLQETLSTILNEVAFKTENDVNTSILGKAKEDLSTFLTDHTSISDDEKAKRISDFFTNTIISVTTQAIQVAGQAPLQAVQMQTMQDETAQKIASMQIQDTNDTNESVQKVISMQNDDKAKLNNSAVNVAKAKAEIETLMPAQVQQITKDIELKSKQIDTEVKKLDVMDKDILIKQQQADLEATKIPLYQAQADNERAKVGLTAQQVRVSATEVQYKLAQLKAIQKAGELNKEIEDNKNLTNIKIAKIYKS